MCRPLRPIRSFSMTSFNASPLSNLRLQWSGFRDGCRQDWGLSALVIWIGSGSCPCVGCNDSFLDLVWSFLVMIAAAARHPAIFGLLPGCMARLHLYGSECSNECPQLSFTLKGWIQYSCSLSYVRILVSIDVEFETDVNFEFLLILLDR